MRAILARLSALIIIINAQESLKYNVLLSELLWSEDQ